MSDQDEGDRCWKCLFTPDGGNCRKGYVIWGCNDPICYAYIGNWSGRGEELKVQGFDDQSMDDVEDNFGK
jgi:hypothetical protein